MPNYEKLTLDRFKLNLKEGKYKNLTGSRRAIGKTTSWSAKEREAAQEIASKHFGSAPTTKAAAKAGPKKVAAKKVAAKAGAKKTAAKKIGRPRVAASVTSSEAPAAKAVVRTPQPESAQDHIEVAQAMLTFASNARGELEALEQVDPSLKTKESRVSLAGIVNDAIGHMNKAAATLLKPATATVASAARIEVPKAKATPALVPPPPESKVETVGEVQQNHTVDDADLTPAERQAKEMFAQNNPGMLGLPPPPQS